MCIGNLIRTLRKKKGLKQVDLAKMAGISVQYLCKIEMGRNLPSRKTLYKIAKALDIDYSLLIK